MINNYENFNKILFKILILKSLKNKFNIILYNKNKKISNNNFIIPKNNFSIVFFKKNNTFNPYNFNEKLINFIYTHLYVLSDFLKNKTIKYNLIYKNLLFKKINYLNLFLYKLYFNKKVFFLKKFSKFFISKSKKYRYKNIYLNKFTKIKKKKKLLSSFTNLKYNFFNYVSYTSELKKFKVKSNFKKISKLNNTEVLFFYSENYTKSALNSNLIYKNISKLNLITNNNKYYSKINSTKKSYSTYIFFNKKNYFKRGRNSVKSEFVNSNISYIYYHLSEVFNFTLKILKSQPNNTYWNNINYFTIFFKRSLQFFLKNFKKFNFFFLNHKNSSFLKIQYKTIKLKSKKKVNISFYKNAYKNIVFLNDFYTNVLKFSKNKNLLSFIYNHHNLNNLRILNNSKILINNVNSSSNLNLYNNYYPVTHCNFITKKRFFSKFKLNFNINFITYMQFYIISFLEHLFKKRIFLKVTNNFFKKAKHTNYLNYIFIDNRNYQPRYMKNFYTYDLIDIIWYSFSLRDLTLLSDWICKFLEHTHFRFHRKFILFFQNFINKYSSVYIDVLRIQGFFFDIRGKVGVAGNSKKRHFFFKMGKLNRSTKIRKINYKHSVVRTPSGALGLTLIINY